MFGLVKEALTQVGKQLTTREIALSVIRAKGWDERDMILRRTVAYRLVQSFRQASKTGRIGDAGVRVWKLS